MTRLEEYDNLRILNPPSSTDDAARQTDLYTDENARDALAAALAATGAASVTVDDAGDTITIGATDTDTQIDPSSLEDGGSNELSVANLSGDLADAQDPKTHGNSSHSTNYADTNHNNTSHSETYATETYVDNNSLPEAVQTFATNGSPVSVTGGSYTLSTGVTVDSAEFGVRSVGVAKATQTTTNTEDFETDLSNWTDPDNDFQLTTSSPINGSQSVESTAIGNLTSDYQTPRESDSEYSVLIRTGSDISFFYTNVQDSAAPRDDNYALFIDPPNDRAVFKTNSTSGDSANHAFMNFTVNSGTVYELVIRPRDTTIEGIVRDASGTELVSSGTINETVHSGGVAALRAEESGVVFDDYGPYYTTESVAVNPVPTYTRAADGEHLVTFQENATSVGEFDLNYTVDRVK